MEKIDKCPDCDGELQSQNIPDVIFDFSLFGYSVQIWNFNNMDKICVYCQTENSQRHERDIYNQGCEDGYTEACEKYSRTRI